jgi:putative tryptophan/tyrosine transport system substrate-binding protein
LAARSPENSAGDPLGRGPPDRDLNPIVKKQEIVALFQNDSGLSQGPAHPSAGKLGTRQTDCATAVAGWYHRRRPWEGGTMFDMRRREFITLLGGAAAWPLAASAQQPPERMRRIGVVRFTKQDQAVVNSLLRGLQMLGWVDGKNVAIEYRDAEGNHERFSKEVNELVRLNPDVIFSFGGEQAPVVKAATSSIPIVVVVSNDPVASGLVASLARPGGNITGVTYVHDMLAGKSVELLKDTAPWVSRVAILWNPGHVDPEFRETQRASRLLDVQLQSLEVRTPSDFEGAFQAAVRERAEALIVIGSRVMFSNRQVIGDFAATNRLILVGVPRWLMEVGALLTFGPNVAELHQRASAYLHKILKGAKPADLPMQQPTTFELIINVKVARSLGLIVPPTVIARADEVIE